MALDGFTLRALVRELDQSLADARLTKIHQPARDEVALVLYHRRRDWRLVLSANPRWARLAVEPTGGENPPAPPPFCMVLRKHLDGARLIGIAQDGLERVVTLTFAVRDELGEPRQKRLLVEIMGRHSNILLIDESDTVIDAIRRVSDDEAPRPLLPGIGYTPPPRPDLPDALTVDRDGFTAAIGRPAWAPATAAGIADSLRDGLFGLSPLLARELCARAGLDPRVNASMLTAGGLDALFGALDGLRSPTTELAPASVTLPGGKQGFSAFALTQYPAAPSRAYPSVSALVADTLGGGRRAEVLAVTRRALAGTVEKELDRCRRKLQKQRDEAAAGAQADHLREAGELILANLGGLAKRLERANLTDWSGNTREVTLDPSLTPSENAQAYFRRYNRAKKAAVAAAAHADQTAAEVAWLEDQALAVDLAADAVDLSIVRAELVSEGYLAPSPAERNRGRNAHSAKGGTQAAAIAERAAPRRLTSADGLEILIGLSSAQNDTVTMKLARPQDLWLHVKDMPGSHVILRAGAEPLPERSIEEAAAYAAWYSRARGATKAPVDFTERRHVRKPVGARPGMVIFDHQRTIMVEPREPGENS